MYANVTRDENGEGSESSARLGVIQRLTVVYAFAQMSWVRADILCLSQASPGAGALWSMRRLKRCVLSPSQMATSLFVPPPSSTRHQMQTG